MPRFCAYSARCSSYDGTNGTVPRAACCTPALTDEQVPVPTALRATLQDGVLKLTPFDLVTIGGLATGLPTIEVDA